MSQGLITPVELLYEQTRGSIGLSYVVVFLDTMNLGLFVDDYHFISNSFLHIFGICPTFGICPHFSNIINCITLNLQAMSQIHARTIQQRTMFACLLF